MNISKIFKGILDLLTIEFRSAVGISNLVFFGVMYYVIISRHDIIENEIKDNKLLYNYTPSQNFIESLFLKEQTINIILCFIVIIFLMGSYIVTYKDIKRKRRKKR